MPSQPSGEDTAAWQRRLALMANNRAWTLTAASARTAEEDEQMLQAARAAMYFWKITGNAGHKAHAAQLVAHVYALLRLPGSGAALPAAIVALLPRTGLRALPP
jgi:hypothetical protein